MIAQRENRDCGLVAMSNYLGHVLDTHDPEAAYGLIRRQYKYPSGDGCRCDLWDSPPRHFRIMEKLTGRKIALVSDPYQPCVVLIRRGWTQYHWMTSLGGGHWHDGYRLRQGEYGYPVVLAYAVDGDAGPLPWYWSLWDFMTRWA